MGVCTSAIRGMCITDHDELRRSNSPSRALPAVVVAGGPPRTSTHLLDRRRFPRRRGLHRWQKAPRECVSVGRYKLIYDTLPVGSLFHEPLQSRSLTLVHPCALRFAWPPDTAATHRALNLLRIVTYIALAHLSPSRRQGRGLHAARQRVLLYILTHTFWPVKHPDCYEES